MYPNSKPPLVSAPTSGFSKIGSAMSWTRPTSFSMIGRISSSSLASSNCGVLCTSISTYQPRSTKYWPGSKNMPRRRNFEPAYWSGSPVGLATRRYAAASILSVRP